VGKTGISFCNFVFLGLRCNSGIKQRGEADLYLQGEGGRRYLTDYNCGFVFQDSTLCSVRSGLVSVPVHHAPKGNLELLWSYAMILGSGCYIPRELLGLVEDGACG
jgi:hypothetical protein